MYHKIVKQLTNYIADELEISSKMKDRIRYGLEIFLSTSITLIFSLIPAIILGTYKVVIVILLTGALLKLFTGGIHMRGPLECAVFTSFFVNLLALFSINYYSVIFRHWPPVILISFIYLFLSLLLWSPADVPERPITEKKKIMFFKIISILFSSILLLITTLLFYFTGNTYGITCTGILSGLIFQALTISPFFYKLQNYYYLFKKT